MTSYAALPVNSTNDGRIIQGGTYGNTADNVTTFKNSTGGGLWLQAGQNLRGVEVDSAGKLTNNGGTFHLFAPGQVVRVDGNIDLKGLQDSQGKFIGNGGKLFIDSSYLYQSGNVYANGINGGLVQFNVGSATFANSARIEAQGFGGQGGIIAINASGPVDIQRQVVLDTSGRVSGSIDTNVINIEGGLINIEGTLQANGVQSRGGTIRLVASGQSDLQEMQEALQDAVNNGTFTSNEAFAINSRLAELKGTMEGDIQIAAATSADRQAYVFANGGMVSNPQDTFGDKTVYGNDPADPNPQTRNGDGGTLIFTAQRDILNGGMLLANGRNSSQVAPNLAYDAGNGGTISLNAGNNIINNARIQANGGNGSQGGPFNETFQLPAGGNGGLIANAYRNSFLNSGVVIANGGAGGESNSTSYVRLGGIVAFVGPASPQLNGLVAVTGGQYQSGAGQRSAAAGTILLPSPYISDNSNTLIGNWHRITGGEFLDHAENLILLKSNFPSSNGQFSELYRWVGDAQYHTVTSAYFFPSSTFLSDKLNMPGEAQKSYVYRNFIITNSNEHVPLSLSGNFLYNSPVNLKDFNTVTILSNSAIQNAETVIGGGLAGGRFSSISPVFSSLADSRLTVAGGVTGGSVNITADNAIQTGILGMRGNWYGGSLILKSNGSIEAGRSITDGGLLGGTQRFIAQTTFYADETLEANGSLNGGAIVVNGTKQVNTGSAPIRAKGVTNAGYINFSSAGSIAVNGPVETK